MKKTAAYHFDLKRSLWTKEYTFGMIDRLKEWNYNTVVIEPEDKLRFRNHPAIAAPEAMSHEAMRELVAYCENKGVSVIPLIQSLGHAESVVGKPEYAHLRETPDTVDQYDPLSDEVKELVLELFDETIEVMQPKEFFHMGGDETWSLGSSEKAKQITDEHGIGGLYLKHMTPLFEHLHSRGLRPMIWADICMSHPEIINRLPDYVVMVDWDYWTTGERSRKVMIWGGIGDSHKNTYIDWAEYSLKVGGTKFEKYLERYAVDEQTREDETFRGFYCTDALKALGVKDVVVAPTSNCGGDITGITKTDRIPNCFYAAAKGMRGGSGFLTTSWAVRHAHNEVQYPATFAAAQGASGAEYDFDSVCAAFTKNFYGKELPDFAQALQLAGPSVYMKNHYTVIGEAQGFVQAKKPLLEGKDIFRVKLEKTATAFGKPGEFIEYLMEIRDGFISAKQLFGKMEKDAAKNKHNFKFWLEGLDLNVFYADFAIAILDDTLSDKSGKMLENLEALKANTAALFSRTYIPESVALEIDVRYGFHELYLSRT